LRTQHEATWSTGSALSLKQTEFRDPLHDQSLNDFPGRTLQPASDLMHGFPTITILDQLRVVSGSHGL
jgi:hypothetical protein